MWETIRRLPEHVIVLLVRLYQRTVSRVLPPTCRFEPSCSTYMIEAVRTHGAIRGLVLGVWRIMRCNPFTSGGLDPVPPRRGRGEPTDEPTGNDCCPR